MKQWLYGLIAACLALLSLHRHGKQQGKQEQKTEQQQKVIDNVEKAKQVSDDVNRASPDDVRDRLRDKLKRK